MPDALHGHSARHDALAAAGDARDVGASLRAVVLALIYVGDSVRVAAGHHVDERTGGDDA